MGARRCKPACSESRYVHDDGRCFVRLILMCPDHSDDPGRSELNEEPGECCQNTGTVDHPTPKEGLLKTKSVDFDVLAEIYVTKSQLAADQGFSTVF